MSDPLSVAGTAVGITSLGIQVCQGLIKYLRAVRGRKEEIRDSVREVEQVVSLLYSLNNTLPNVGIRNGTNSLRTCVNTCYAKLEELRNLLDELSDCQDTKRAGKRAADIVRAVSYPFQQEKLDTMRQSLRSILDDLGLIMSIISLDSNTAVHDTVNDISRDLKDHFKSHNDDSVDLQTRMHRNSVQLRALQTAISKTLSDIQEQLHQTQISIQDLGKQINGKLTIVEAGTRSIEASNQITVAMLDRMTQALEFQSALMSTMGIQINDARSSRDTGVMTTDHSTDVPIIRSDLSSPKTDVMKAWEGCYCSSAIPKSTTFFKFWNLKFLFEEQEHHLPTCKLWGTRKGTKQRAKAEFQFKLTWLSTRITCACFEYASGTSRPSVLIRLKNVVPGFKNPVRKAIFNFIEGCSIGIATNSQAVLKLKSLECEIVTLYYKGLASPLDTDEEDWTDVENLFFFFGLAVCQQDERYPATSTLRRIIQSGALTIAFVSCIRTLLQAHDYDSQALCFTEFLFGSRFPGKSEQETNNLDYLTSSLYGNSYLPISDENIRGIANIKPWPTLISLIQSATDLSPISKSILSRSIKDLIACVAKDPDSVLECIFDVDIVRLSVAWSEGLEYLLTTKASTLVSKGSSRYHCELLSQAAGLGEARSVHILLKAGCCFPYEKHWHGNISEDVVTAMATHISMRRIKLLKAIQTHLGLFLGNESVTFADSTAAKICDALDKANLQVNPCLRVPSDYQSIYLNTTLPFDTFPQIWQKGFRHYKCHDRIGLTPVMTRIYDWDKILKWPLNWQHAGETIHWLSKHGFMEERAKDPLNIGLDTFATGYHYTGAAWAYLSRYDVSKYHGKDGHRLRFLTELSSNVTTHDGCTCWCNAEGHGCSPIKLFLKTLFLRTAGSLLEVRHDETLHSILHHQTFHVFQSDELSNLAKEALRLLTFEALDMTHTCCLVDKMGDHDPCNLLSWALKHHRAIFCQDPDKVVEIRSCENEQRSAALLEDLMAEFIPQLQLFNPSPLAFEGFVRTYFRRRISQLYSQDLTVVDDLRQYQVFQGFGVPSSPRGRVFPENLHRLLGKDFDLLDTHEYISDEECIAEVSRYMGMKCEDCLPYKRFEGSTCDLDCCQSN